jgi:uncharacterized protein YjiS (DUF1127 family)
MTKIGQQQRAFTVAAALYPVAGIWPARPEPEEPPDRRWTFPFVAEFRRFRAMREARKARRSLMELDDRMLRDVGLSRCQLLGLELDRGSARPRRRDGGWS